MHVGSICVEVADELRSRRRGNKKREGAVIGAAFLSKTSFPREVRLQREKISLILFCVYLLIISLAI